MAIYLAHLPEKFKITIFYFYFLIIFLATSSTQLWRVVLYWPIVKEELFDILMLSAWHCFLYNEIPNYIFLPVTPGLTRFNKSEFIVYTASDKVLLQPYLVIVLLWELSFVLRKFSIQSVTRCKFIYNFCGTKIKEWNSKKKKKYGIISYTCHVQNHKSTHINTMLLNWLMTTYL